MMDVLEFPIHFHWISLKTKITYHIIRLRYEAATSISMTLTDGELLILEHGTAHWCEFVLHIHSHHFTVPRSHGLRGMVSFHKLKNKLRVDFEQL